MYIVVLLFLKRIILINNTENIKYIYLALVDLSATKFIHHWVMMQYLFYYLD